MSLNENLYGVNIVTINQQLTLTDDYDFVQYIFDHKCNNGK